MEQVVHTTHGTVRGTSRDGVAAFLGIPYAAPPTGPLRFAAPAPPEPWAGVRPATSYGATPPSPGYRPPYDTMLRTPVVAGEEWLNLNVWTPDPGGSGLPVMVWIHGGAFTNGNSATPLYDGHAFARDGVVLVSVNYRLGVDGFAHLPGAPANRGLLDQVAALEWVQDNIVAFGGDPARVTVFGESAGAMNVTTLMAMPRARGLFAAAITQSGAAQAAATAADAELVAAELLRQLTGDETGRRGAAPAGWTGAADLARVPLPDLLAAQQRVTDALATDSDPERFGASVVAASMAFVPVVDGDSLPAAPADALASGDAVLVPQLTGTTTEEYNFFTAPTGLVDAFGEEGLVPMGARLGLDADGVARYRANRPGTRPGEVFSAMVTDAYFRAPALRWVTGRGRTPTWVYEFGWRTAHLGLGAAHAMELPFVFDTLAAPGATGLTGEGAPQSVADEMHAAWVRFAAAGDPGWDPYDEKRAVMLFDGAGARVELDPRGDERRLWE